MCEVKDFYASMGINLYINNIRNIDNTEYTDNLYIDALNNIDNTVNIYAFKRLPESYQFCGYYTPFYDLIIIPSYWCLNTNTMIHELGHFFSLPHTFSGFPIGLDNCGVYVTSGEKVDGSNCTTAGDRICDTPPDNNSLGNQTCPGGMTCLQYDPDGVAFMPDPTNHMSYFRNSCQNKLTDGQVAVMIDNIENERVDFINPAPLNINPVVEAVELNSPTGIEIPYDRVLFEWDAVPNANLYHIEISRSSSFLPSFRIAHTFTTENQYVSKKLKKNTTYHWRVLPVNGANTCSISDIWASGSFTTNDQTVLLPHIEDFNVSPNPAQNESVTISLTGRRFMIGQLHLYTKTGQRVHSKNIQVFEGANSFDLDVRELAAGLYLVYAEFDEEAVWQKLIIQ